MPDAWIGEGVRVLVLGSGKVGHEINALGVAEALGAPYELRRVYAALAVRLGCRRSGRSIRAIGGPRGLGVLAARRPTS